MLGYGCKLRQFAGILRNLCNYYSNNLLAYLNIPQNRQFPSHIYLRLADSVHHDIQQVDARTDAARAYARKKVKADGCQGNFHL